MIETVNLKQKLAQIDAPWVPKIVGEMEGHYVKAAKFEGEYVWHKHDDEDEMFLVVEGRIEIHLRDRVLELSEGEFAIIPKGVEHKPVAAETASVVLFEPASTRNTGNVDHAYTIEADELDRI